MKKKRDKLMIHLKMRLLFVIVFILAWANASTQAAVYYVKNNGDDRASGLSDAAAWKTVAKVNDFAEATGFKNGDAIYFKGGDTFSDEAFGDDGGNIVWGTLNGLNIGSYGIGNAIFDCNKINETYCFRFDAPGVSNLKIENLTFNGMDGDFREIIHIEGVNGVEIDRITVDANEGSSVFPRPDRLVMLVDIGGDIHVHDSTIKNGYPGKWGDWSGHDCVGLRLVYNFSGGDPKTDGTVTIENNIITNMYSDSIAIEKIQSKNFYIRNNTLGNYSENSLDSKGSHNWQYYGNTVYRKWDKTAGSSPGAASCIVIHDSRDDVYETENAKIFNNYFYAEDKECIRLEEARNIEVSRNLFKGIGRTLRALWVSGLDFENNIIIADAVPEKVNDVLYIAGNAKNDDIKIVNNSIYVSHSSYTSGIRWEAVSGQSGDIVRNNAVMIEAASSACPLYVKDGDSSKSFPEVGYNIWYNADHVNRVYWDGKTFGSSDQKSWQSAGHPNGLFLNPNFNNPKADDLRLTSNSPCTDCGADVKLLKAFPISASWLSPPNNLKIK